MIELSPEQKIGCDVAIKWLDNPQNHKSKPIFRIFGYAGTGKTTIIRTITSQLELTVAYAAFTGKAAMVMQKQGLPATTIHSLIYRPIPPSKKECDTLFEKIKKCENKREKSQLYNQLNEARKVKFALRSDPPDCDLIVLDECSMVNQEMLDDLLSFEIPIIALGDPGQLPPINGPGAIIAVPPDVLLTEVHRQAKDNPIIDFATRARKGIPLPYMKDGAAKCLSRSQVGRTKVLTADQVITGKNATRRELNNTIREHFGFNSVYPDLGEKLICLANDRIDAGDGEMIPIYNGMMGIVTEVGEILDTAIMLKIKFEALGDPLYDEPLDVKVLLAHFHAYHEPTALQNVRWWDRRDNQEFDFGYAITVHKSQGSQWDNVVLWDDKFLTWDRKERAKWLYTGITRASKELLVVSN